VPGSTIFHQVDSQEGNSGSPIIRADQFTIGIHVQGGCDVGGANIGTSFQNDTLAIAMAESPGLGTIYVDDFDYPGSCQIGALFCPFRTIGQAVDSVPYYGEQLSIVKGRYSEAITITKKVTLTAPVGSVTIGR